MSDEKRMISHIRYWRWPIIVCVPVIIVMYLWCWWWPPQVTTIYLVRHAEKGSGDNPALTLAGQQRALDLKTLLRSADLEAVYSSEFCRTAQTAQPTAQDQSLNLSILTYAGSQANFAVCDPGIQVPTQVPDASTGHATTVATHILANHKGKEVLLVGHSNTVPEIATALGAGSLCPDLAPFDANGDCHIPSTQFDNFFIVTVYGKYKTTQTRLRYGG